jgi:hypothetical protein
MKKYRGAKQVRKKSNFKLINVTGGKSILHFSSSVGRHLA